MVNESILEVQKIKCIFRILPGFDFRRVARKTETDGVLNNLLYTLLNIALNLIFFLNAILRL